MRPHMNRVRCATRHAACATIMIAALTTSQAAKSFELEPNEFVTVPAGTSALLGYFIWGGHDSYRPIGGPTVKHDTNFDDYLGIGRAATWFDLGGMESLVEVLQPFGAYANAKIGGSTFPDVSGAGDTTIAAAIWPVNNKASQTYVGLALYVTFPDGEYDTRKGINLSGHRMQYDPQFAVHQGFGKEWSVDLTADLIVYGDNTEAGNGQQTLKQNPTPTLQGFVNYAWPFGVTTSIGYEGDFGGRASIEGLGTGAKTEFQEVRFVASHFFTPTFQLLGEVNHQFESVGGFRQNIGVTLRALYVF